MAGFPSFVLPTKPKASVPRIGFKIKPPAPKKKPAAPVAPVIPGLTGGSHTSAPAPKVSISPARRPAAPARVIPKVSISPGGGFNITIPKKAPTKTGLKYALKPPVVKGGDVFGVPLPKKAGTTKRVIPSAAAPKASAPVSNPRSGPPVAAGSATGSASAAPGANAAAASRTPVEGPPAADPTQAGLNINSLYDPAFKALQAVQDRNNALKKEAQDNLAAFQNWQGSRATGTQDFLTKNFQDSSGKTAAAMAAINASLASRSQLPGYLQGVAGQSGAGAAMDAGALRQDAVTQAGALPDFVTRALALRQADQGRVDTAMAGDLQTKLDMGTRAKQFALDDQNRQLTLQKIAAQIQEKQSARQAAIDSITANSLAGNRAATTQIAQNRLNLDTAKFNFNQFNQDRNYILAKQRLAKTASGNTSEDVIRGKLLTLGFAAYKNSRAGWAAEEKKNGKPLDQATKDLSMRKAIQRTTEILHAQAPKLSQTNPQAIVDVLQAVFGSAALAKYAGG